MGLIKKLANCLPKWLSSFTFPPAKYVASYPCQHFTVSLFYLSHSNNSVVVSHCSFIMHFPNEFDNEHLFRCLFSIYIPFLVMCLSKFLPTFKFFVLLLMSLYLLDKVLFRCDFENTSPSLGLSFLSLECEKEIFLIWVKSNTSLDCAFGVIAKNLCLMQGHKGFLFFFLQKETVQHLLLCI